MTLRFSRARRSPAERFWEKVIPEPNTGCWLWAIHAAVRRLTWKHVGDRHV